MTTLHNRINRLETKRGVHAKYKYMCVIGSMHDAFAPEERAKGYKVQPWIESFGGNGGAPFYLATREELYTFAARDDVDLIIVVTGANEESELIKQGA